MMVICFVLFALLVAALICATAVALWLGGVAILAAPAWETVSRLTFARRKALLPRDGLEGLMLLLAGALAALAAWAAVALAAAAGWPWQPFFMAGCISTALAPWAAAELLTGPSMSAGQALRGALIAASVFAWLGAFGELDTVFGRLLLSGASSFAATLALRGDREPSGGGVIGRPPGHHG